MVNTLDKDFSKKLIAMSLFINSALPMIKLSVEVLS